MEKMMDALVKTEAGRGLVLKKMPVPVPGAGEVLIKIHKTAICGTDVHIYTWDPWSQKHLTPPVIAGHEYVGEIAELGPGVTGFETDDMARKYLADKGYGTWPHSLGHQVGRFVHDGGALLSMRKPGREKLVDQPLTAGNVFAVEPAAYLKEGCFCIEEMVVLTENGAEFLTKPQQEVYVLKG